MWRTRSWKRCFASQLERESLPRGRACRIYLQVRHRTWGGIKVLLYDCGEGMPLPSRGVAATFSRKLIKIGHNKRNPAEKPRCFCFCWVFFLCRWPHLVFGLLLCFVSAAGLQGRVTGDGAYRRGLQENKHCQNDDNFKENPNKRKATVLNRKKGNK